MNGGRKVLCPHCGEKTLVRERKVFDENFSPVGVKFVCAFCGGELELPSASDSVPAPSKQEEAAERLSRLLGGERAAKAAFAPEADDGHFCLHCRNFVKHPFMNRCGLTMKEVQAIDSCEKFEAAE
ncbi:MAG: hypothetical protein IJT50_07565 [Lentisphaeria bacterium]|jgi:DNA-directed RNA polymerase subunit RPC12/RpoP|nr:hypothetical protein [Lentisphaeria bacterium]